jgi:hypothetical protein
MTDEDNDFWEYGYNGRNEVTSGTKKRGTATLPYQQFGYAFDAIGNRMTASQNFYQTASRTYNSLNQASSGTNSSSVAIIGQADAAPTTSLTLNGQTITNRNGADLGASVSGSKG